MITLYKMKGSDIIRHFAGEGRKTAETEVMYSPGYNQQMGLVDMLRNLRLNMAGRHVLVEKDFTKDKNESTGV